jgi:hypothetical protein
MPDYYTWENEEQRAKAYIRSDAIEGYGAAEKSVGWNDTYIDIEPNRSVRPQMGRSDYNRFRPGESIPKQQKRIKKMCMEAYDKVGIIHNVIDLMGDFASQGISLLHENKSQEKFYRKWFDMVSGPERSERFLNYLYRAGDVIIFRETGIISPKRAKEFKRAKADGFSDQDPITGKRRVPTKYTFLNPLSVDVKDSKAANVLNERQYVMKVGIGLNVLRNSTYREKFDNLPESLKQNITKNNEIDLPNDQLRVYHYKKDDWSTWSNPMVYPILDDLITLEKMRLADRAALDGAISNIRLWTLGSLEHGIGPQKAVMNKLRDILASHVGGGTMDLVWGPELTFKESSTQLHHFLGQEKYAPIYTAVYGGLGIPQTLTGSSGGGNQGFTNNFVSIKTLVERLEYGRSLLVDFWNHEMRMVANAMNFKDIPTIRFDSIVLSDESSHKKLLLDLADRNIISHETVMERFNEVPHIEKKRVQKEERERRNDKMPDKASPYHDANLHNEITKILVQSGLVSKDSLDDMGFDTLDDMEKLNRDRLVPKPTLSPSSTPSGSPGRPKTSKDSTPRKTKRVLPRSKASLMSWAKEAQDKIAKVLAPAALDCFGKSNLRQLTKEESVSFEREKMHVLASLEFMEEPTEENIIKIVSAGLKTDSEFMEIYSSYLYDYVKENEKKPPVNIAREAQILTILTLAET